MSALDVSTLSAELVAGLPTVVTRLVAEREVGVTLVTLATEELSADVSAALTFTEELAPYAYVRETESVADELSRRRSASDSARRPAWEAVAVQLTSVGRQMPSKAAVSSRGETCAQAPPASTPMATREVSEISTTTTLSTAADESRRFERLAVRLAPNSAGETDTRSSAATATSKTTSKLAGPNGGGGGGE